MSRTAAHDGAEAPFLALGISILVVSDSRSLATDKSGKLLEDGLLEAGHRVTLRAVVADEVEAIQACVSTELDRPEVHSIILTGGTGLAARDVTPEAVMPLFDKEIPGFGELFRMLSYPEIGTACLQSRACAGIARGKAVWALPGSSGACRLALQQILLPQLDSREKPCSVSKLLFS